VGRRRRRCPAACVLPLATPDGAQPPRHLPHRPLPHPPLPTILSRKRMAAGVAARLKRCRSSGLVEISTWGQERQTGGRGPGAALREHAAAGGTPFSSEALPRGRGQRRAPYCTGGGMLLARSSCAWGRHAPVLSTNIQTYSACIHTVQGGDAARPPGRELFTAVVEADSGKGRPRRVLPWRRGLWGGQPALGLPPPAGPTPLRQPKRRHRQTART
jgi:hypothetical protein